MLNLLFISGSFPPQEDGVADFGEKLFFELKKIATVDIVYFDKKANNMLLNNHYKVSNWGWKTLYNLHKASQKNSYDKILLQAPAHGYEGSILIGFYSLFFRVFSRKKLVIYLHEYSNRTFIGKTKLALLCSFVHKIIINDERYIPELKKFFFFPKKIQTVFEPVGSNISVSSVTCKKSDIYKIGYFGMVRPGKGTDKLFDVLNLVQQKTSKKVELHFMGKVLNPELVSQENSAVFFRGKIEENKISEAFSEMNIFLQLFDEGLTGKRGSFIAPFLSCKPVITTKPKTRVWEFVCDKNTSFVDDLSEASLIEISNKILDDINGKAPLPSLNKEHKINIWGDIAKSVLN